jgi:hypothetical protein
VLKKKIWANFQRIIELFPQKIVTKLSKVWVWDPGSGKNLFRISDPGSRIQGSKRHRIPYPGSGSATLVPGALEALVEAQEILHEAYLLSGGCRSYFKLRLLRAFLTFYLK